MKFEIKSNEMYIYLEGNIDTNNAEEVGEELNRLRDENSECKIILDAEKLNYISSAGLRQILKLKKKHKDLRIINCSSEVYEIFDMTGFAEMMEITKAYKQMSVEGCEKLGEGSNGIVYRLNPDTIIKVYKNPDAISDIKRERELAKTALVMGINTAIPFDVVKVGDKYGSVFELLSAKSLTKLIKEEPEKIDKYLKIFVDMLKEIHATPVNNPEIPDQKKIGKTWVEYSKGHLPNEEYNKLLKLFENIEETGTLLHGDYHTSNVHYANGEAILIDMDTLAKGSPIFEFASLYLAYRGYGEVKREDVTEFMKMDWDTCQYILDNTIKLYFEDKPQEYIDAIVAKARLIGYVRMLRRTLKRYPDNKELIEHSKIMIHDLLEEVNDLNI